MTTTDIAGLCERLRAGESSRHDGVTTNWYRNPDGPQAADTLERQAAEIERLRRALVACRGAAAPLLEQSEDRVWRRAKLIVDTVDAALTGEDT